MSVRAVRRGRTRARRAASGSGHVAGPSAAGGASCAPAAPPACIGSWIEGAWLARPAATSSHAVQSHTAWWSVTGQPWQMAHACAANAVAIAVAVPPSLPSSSATARSRIAHVGLERRRARAKGAGTV